MTTIRPSVRRDAFHAVWLLALVVPLLMAVPYLFVVGVFGLAVMSEPDGTGDGAGSAVAACGLLLLLAVAVPVLATALTARRGYRIAPLSLWTAGPVLAVALSSVVRL
ncbi:hypothetical protein [Kitasatospora cineracea]|uniref:Uncharacterized protein n=1 Tax=Kitasatospora cineracea TaxID=88074 RepID=A0A3N4RTK1_9ACTN|nr:hypothetical protein [Kitasatospora cineracea]ROR43952.1 hypothetical protein EDD39_2125 [Kitasatospora cineracea]RPE34301.1 hypothetical protein EDD38_2616 [Kitasatospora cineracea]